MYNISKSFRYISINSLGILNKLSLLFLIYLIWASIIRFAYCHQSFIIFFLSIDLLLSLILASLLVSLLCAFIAVDNFNFGLKNLNFVVLLKSYNIWWYWLTVLIILIIQSYCSFWISKLNLSNSNTKWIFGKGVLISLSLLLFMLISFLWVILAVNDIGSIKYSISINFFSPSGNNSFIPCSIKSIVSFSALSLIFEAYILYNKFVSFGFRYIPKFDIFNNLKILAFLLTFLSINSSSHLSLVLTTNISSKDIPKEVWLLSKGASILIWTFLNLTCKLSNIFTTIPSQKVFCFSGCGSGFCPVFSISIFFASSMKDCANWSILSFENFNK